MKVNYNLNWCFFFKFYYIKVKISMFHITVAWIQKLSGVVQAKKDY